MKQKGSQSRQRNQDTRSLDKVHTDILGSIDPIAVDDHRYAIGFVDSFSGT